MLIGFSNDRMANELKVNPSNLETVHKGQYLFYIHSQRICGADIGKLLPMVDKVA